MRAALYERVSTDEQRIHGLSLDAQREVLEEYAKNHGMVVAGHYTDAGVSGQKPLSKRPALRPFEALYGIKGGMVSAVDLLKGIAVGAGMKVYQVPGATGSIDTNFEGKAQAAIEKTEAFFAAMGNPPRLSAYGLGEEVIEAVAAKLIAHGHVALGEHADITPEDAKAMADEPAVALAA